jgi:hypothetical protein
MDIPAWTSSQLDAFETCPRQFYLIKVEKSVKETKRDFADWGQTVHTAFEVRIRDGVPLPDGMHQWEPLAKKLIALPGTKLSEQKYALDQNFLPTDWSTAWTRGIVDLSVVSGYRGAALDYKTGKRKLTDQLKLYAGYMFAYHPELEKVSTGFVWLRDKKIDKEVFHREDVPAIWQSFLPRVRRLEIAYETGRWPPRPNGLCKQYCPCLGCEFNGGK